MKQFEKIEVMLKSSKPVFKCDMISEEQLGTSGETVETYAAHFKVPFMEPRLILNCKYWIPSENIVLISSEGNEEIRAQYIKDHDIEVGKSYIVSVTYISGYQFNPIYDDKDPTKIVGTHVIQVAESNFGGSMPAWMVKKGQPKGMIEGYDKLIEDIKKANKHNKH